jgi:hypothetical protein
MNFPYSRSAAQICAAIHKSERALITNGRSLKRKRRLNEIPVKAAAPIANLRITRKVRESLIARIRGKVRKSANGPEKRIFPIMMETTRARDSMTLLSKCRSGER